MINVNDNFKIDIRTYGRQFDVQLKANNTDISSDDLNYLKPSFNTSLFKTVMHQIEIDSKLYMPADTKITGKIGVKVNEKTYNYINLNNYYVKSCERQEDTNSYRILAYTKMKESMIDYDLTLIEKITVRNYLIKICQRLGWNTSNIPATFINSEKLVDPSLHTGINYSFRDALDELATITCSFFMFKGDEFYLLYLTETNESIDETYLDEDNITIGEKYIINSLVFSRAEESDNIFRKDDTSIATNGLHEYRISDCQLLSTNDRSDYIDEMFNYLKTLSFYIFDVQSKGILFLEACDIFNFVLNEVTYKTILLNDEIELDDGLTEKLYTDEPEETQTEYKYADSTDKKINQTYILVDKQNQKITQLTKETTENSEKLTKVEQDVNGIDTKVSSVEQSVENITNTQNTATGKNIHLEDSSDEPLVSIKVKGSTTQSTRSGKNLFNLNNIRNVPSVFTVTETGVNLTNDWAGDVFTFENIAKTFKANTTYTMKAKAKVVSRPSTIVNINDNIFLFYRPASDELKYINKSILGMPDKQTIALNTEKEYITSFTTPEDMTNVRFLSYTFHGNNDGSTTGTALGEIDVSEIMLVEGSYTTETFPEYEQYGASPSPDYRSPIENVEGKNKFNKSNMTEAAWDNGKTNTVTLLKDGRIQSTANYAQWSAKCIDIPNLKANTDYVVSGKIISSTANNAMIIVKGYKNNTLSNIIYHQYAVATRFELSFNSSDYEKIGISLSGSNNTLGTTYTTIFDEIQIEEGTVATPYAPYNSLEIKDVGKQILNKNAVTFSNGASKTILNTGIRAVATVAGQYRYLAVELGREKLLGKEITFSTNIEASAENNGRMVAWFGNATSPAVKRLSIPLNETGKQQNTFQVPETFPTNCDRIWILFYCNFNGNANVGDYVDYTDLMVVIGDIVGEYEDYQEQKVDFPLSEGQKLYKASYLASNGIHHNRAQTTVNISNIVTLSNGNIGGIFQPAGKKYSDNNGLCCDKAKYDPNRRFITDTVYENSGNVVFVGNSTDTLETLKAKYDGAILEYELSEEEIIPYTEAQQEAWNKIEQLHTYKNVTNIFSTAELDITYVRDNGLSDMYETKQNANKNYTKTIQKLAEQKITTDEISSKVSSLETTTVKEIQVQYALGDSSVTAPETGWNTTAPEWQNGKYMWQRTVTVYANETTVESSATCIQGAKGEDGKKGDTGATGTGIKSIQEQYYLSTSNTTQTGGSWKNTQDIWTVGKYIWTRSHITWSDNTTTDTTPVLAQGLNTANETANDTKENLENNYSTTVEMNSAITAKANEITTEVNKKVNETDLGTKIEQNYEHVKLAWNQISEFIQMMIINNNASFAILDENKKVMMALDKTGQHFYKSDGTTIFGEMAVNKEEDGNYISFAVEGDYDQDISNGMAWGIKTKSDKKFHPIFYIKNFHMSEKNSDASYGELLLTSCNLILNGMNTGIQSGNIKMYGDDANSSINFINTDTSELLLSISTEDLITGNKKINMLDAISFFENEGGTNSFKIGNDDNNYVLIEDDGSLHAMGGDILLGTSSKKVSFDVYPEITANIWGNLNITGNVYASNISSDKRIKKNIKDSTTSALDIIKKIKHKEFDKKDDGKHYKIGYIAQDMEQIDSNFVIKRPEDKDKNIEERYYINELPIIATLTKAIQELQEQNEEQQKTMKKMQQEINELKDREV